jgi:adenine-specific DNA-methyltransferase
MTSGVFDYFRLKMPGMGVSGGFAYKRVPHITLGDIARNPQIKPGMNRALVEDIIRANAQQEDLYDQPEVDRDKVRVTGPFTVEAVPAPAVRPLHEITPDAASASAPAPAVTADASVARSGETARQQEWRDELLRAGVRGRKGGRLKFNRCVAAPGLRYLHAIAEGAFDDETACAQGRETGGKRVAVSFGPAHAPMDQRQVELALEEAHALHPKPAVLLFAAFQFDPEAAKDIDEIDETRAGGITLLKAQMTPDLLTDDLKKKRAVNETFWLIGQPDVVLRRVKGSKDLHEVEVKGFDYFNPASGKIESGGVGGIAMWALDPEYDRRSLFPRQVFFPMAGEKDGWSRLAKTLRAELDEDKVEHLRGTVSLPFKPGRFVAVKIVDDRGIESLRVLEVSA